MRNGFLATACAALLSSTAAEAAPPTWLDRSFGSDGLTLQAFTTSRSNTAVRAMRMRPDGAILVAGARTDGDHFAPRLMRFTADGAPDPAFGSEGVFELALDATSFPKGGAFSALDVLADGRIVVLGAIAAPTQSWFFTTRLFIARITADGELDTSFADGAGFRTYDFRPYVANAGFSPGGTLALDATGGMLVGTSVASNDSGLVRLHADGTVDASYGVDGVASLGMPRSISRIVLDDTERVYLAGSNMTLGRLDLFRMLPGGTLDASFGTSGATTIHTGQTGDLALTGSVRLDASGHPLIGYTPARQGGGSLFNESMNVARFVVGGLPDTSFNANQQQMGPPGKAEILYPQGTRMNEGSFAIPSAGGDIMTVGLSNLDGGGTTTLLRIRNDASSDPAFASPVQLRILAEGSDHATAFEVDSAGRIVLAGWLDGQADCMFLMRIIPDRLFAEGSDPSSAPTACPD